MTVEEMTEVLQAFSAGKTIQQQHRVLHVESEWHTLGKAVVWDFVNFRYRAVPDLPEEIYVNLYTTGVTPFYQLSLEAAEKSVILSGQKGVRTVKFREVKEGDLTREDVEKLRDTRDRLAKRVEELHDILRARLGLNVVTDSQVKEYVDRINDKLERLGQYKKIAKLAAEALTGNHEVVICLTTEVPFRINEMKRYVRRIEEKNAALRKELERLKVAVLTTDDTSTVDVYFGVTCMLMEALSHVSGTLPRTEDVSYVEEVIRTTKERLHWIEWTA